MRIKTINETIIDHQLVDSVKQDLKTLGWSDGNIIEQLEGLEQSTDRVDITIAERNRLVNLQRTLYAKGFQDTIANQVDEVLLAHSDEYQVGNINAHTFRKQFVKDVEKMYPYVNEASIMEEELGGEGVFKKVTEIWKKSEACPSLLKKLIEQEAPPTAVEKFRKDMKEEYTAFLGDVITENEKLKSVTEDRQATEERLKKVRSEI